MVFSDVLPPSRKAAPLFSLELMGTLLSKANPHQAHRSGLCNHLGPEICVATLGLGYVQEKVKADGLCHLCQHLFSIWYKWERKDTKCMD